MLDAFIGCFFLYFSSTATQSRSLCRSHSTHISVLGLFDIHVWLRFVANVYMLLDNSRERFSLKPQTCCLPKIPNAHRTYFIAEWEKIYIFKVSNSKYMRLNLRTVCLQANRNISGMRHKVIIMSHNAILSIEIVMISFLFFIFFFAVGIYAFMLLYSCFSLCVIVCAA